MQKIILKIGKLPLERILISSRHNSQHTPTNKEKGNKNARLDFRIAVILLNEGQKLLHFYEYNEVNGK